MSTSLKKKISGAIVAFMMGVIALSFIVTGVDTSFKGSPDTLGHIGKYPIKIREYSQELERQSQFYAQFSGGNPLTKEQIEAFRLRENALNNVTTRLLMINFADEIGLNFAPKEVVQQIRDIPNFQVKGQFDLNTYKAILPNIGYSAEEFEQLIARDLKLQNLRSLTQTIGLSQKSLIESKKAQATLLQLTAMTLNKENLFKSVPVSAEEISTYLASKEGLDKTQALFESRKPQLDVKAEIKGRHILLTTEGKSEEEVKKQIDLIAKEVTPANFTKIADQKTEDPSGKGKGGDLGWFSPGMMVPEFDEVAFSMKEGTISAPVKTQFGYHLIFVEAKKTAQAASFENYKDTLAKELLQKNKKDAITQLTSDLSVQVQDALESNDDKKLTELAATHGLELKSKLEISLLNGDLSFPDINFDQILESAKAAKSGQAKVLRFDGPLKLVFVKPLQLKMPAAITPEQIKEEDQKQKNVLMRKLNEDLVKILEEKFYTEKDKKELSEKIDNFSTAGLLR